MIAKASTVQVPISYYDRSHDQGKKITWRDALACAWILLRVRVVRASKMQPVKESHPLRKPAKQECPFMDPAAAVEVETYRELSLDAKGRR